MNAINEDLRTPYIYGGPRLANGLTGYASGFSEAEAYELLKQLYAKKDYDLKPSEVVLISTFQLYDLELA